MCKNQKLSTFLGKVEKVLRSEEEDLKAFDEVVESIYDLLSGGGDTSSLIYEDGDWYIPQDTDEDIFALNILEMEEEPQEFAEWFLMEG